MGTWRRFCTVRGEPLLARWGAWSRAGRQSWFGESLLVQNVETWAPLRSSGSRSRISMAAFRLNASARMVSGGTPWFRTKWAILPMMTAVLPVPAPASTNVASS